MLNEQQLEDLCIGWFQQTGWQFAHGPDMAPEGDQPERADFRQVVLRDRLLLARELLRDPNWPLRAARELGVTTPAVSRRILEAAL